MPQMNGRELARRLEARRPGLKTVYMSGYPANAIAPTALWRRAWPSSRSLSRRKR
jgi:CheY-like chemotaxis protein